MRKQDGPNTRVGNKRQSKAPLTRPFDDTIVEMLRERVDFREAMLREGVDAVVGGELNVAKSILRNYINAALGFERLSKEVGIPPKSLMRMFGPSGNPSSKNLLSVIAALQRHAGIELHLAAE